MPRRMKFTLAAPLLALALSGLTACKSSDSPIFFTSPSSPFPDVPVPASFELVSSQNAGPAVGNSRNMEYIYRSTDSPIPVSHFFASKLPPQGWTLQSQNQTDSQALLQFSKAGETLQISVSSGSVRMAVATPAIRQPPPTGQSRTSSGAPKALACLAISNPNVPWPHMMSTSSKAPPSNGRKRDSRSTDRFAFSDAAP